MKSIRTQKDYNEAFKENVREKALHHAHEIRKFEIELYWKRATYFWTLIAATFAGYFALSASEHADKLTSLSLVIACIGLVLSIGWYQVNRGSKYWQSNWERHVDCLEDPITGPLYKTTISKEQFDACNLTGGYPISVSKINQIISLFVITIWAALLIKAAFKLWLPLISSQIGYGILLITTLLFIISLLRVKSSGVEGKGRPVDFIKCNTE